MSSVPIPDEYDSLEEWIAAVAEHRNADRATLDEFASQLDQSEWAE
jgi:hypothetical protein